MKAVVLSPHLDDAVMSIGATLNSLRRRGAQIMLLTAFAGDPERRDHLSYWDAKRDVSGKSEAQLMRRKEDEAAAAVLQIDRVNLPFDDFAYLSPRDPEVIRTAIEAHLLDADVVFVPGWPLSHPDHRYLAAMFAQHPVKAEVLYYQEMPYGAQPTQLVKRLLRGRRVPTISHALGVQLTWRPTFTSPADFAAKREAIACYAGEVAALGRLAALAKLYDRIARSEVVGAIGASDITAPVYAVDR